MHEVVPPAVQRYVDALAALWADPSFEPDSYQSSNSAVVTQADANAVRLPRSGRLVRGAAGVSTRAYKSAPPTGVSTGTLISKSVFTSTSGRIGMDDQQPSDVGVALQRSFRGLVDALYRESPLSHRVYESVGKKTGGQTIDAAIAELNEENKGFLVMLFLNRLLERTLSANGFDAANRRQFAGWNAVGAAIIQELSQLELRRNNRYLVTAFLNGPVYDSNVTVAITEGEQVLYALGFAPVTDEMLKGLLEWHGNGDRLVPGADLANSALTFELSLSVDAGVEQYATLYPLAAEIARFQLDVLRIVHGGDIGISNLLIEPADWAMPQVPRDRAWDFESEVAIFNPRRTAFWSPNEPLLTDEQLAEVRELTLAQFRLPNVKGFRIALGRFRDAWERYQPLDPERLLDITVALEALYLNDSDNKDLRYRLALRGARWLRTDLADRKRVFQTLQWLYDFRSKIAHGAVGRLRPAEEGRLTSIQREAPALLRESLRKILQGHGPTGLDDADLANWWRTIELT